jgi:hypothetical protein
MLIVHAPYCRQASEARVGLSQALHLFHLGSKNGSSSAQLASQGLDILSKLFSRALLWRSLDDDPQLDIVTWEEPAMDQDLSSPVESLALPPSNEYVEDIIMTLQGPDKVKEKERLLALKDDMARKMLNDLQLVRSMI